MADAPIGEREKPWFIPYHFEGLEVIQNIEGLMEAGRLPFDALFRLASIGHCQPDLLSDSDRPQRLSWVLMHDMVAHADTPETMRPDTQKLLWGDRPDAIIDWAQNANWRAYAQLDPMYYRMANLARVIKQRRAEQGKTVTEIPAGWHTTPKELEKERCFGLARPIWRVIIQRTHPEWLDRPRDYYAPTWSFNNVYEAGERTMRRRITDFSVLSDSVVLKMYTEAKETGVRGIGPVGRQSLRTLLSDEHPELM